MTVGRWRIRSGLALLVLLGLLTLVLINRPAAAPRSNGGRGEVTTPVVVVKTLPNDAIECSVLTTAPRDEGVLLYYWKDRGLMTARCRPAPSGGGVGLG